MRVRGMACGIRTRCVPVVAMLAVAASVGAGTPASAGAAAPARLVVAGAFHPGLMAGAVAHGRTPAATRMQISLVLRLRGGAALARRVESGGFRQGSFLSVSQFAARYGQTPAAVAEIRTYLRSHGLRTRVYADRLVIAASGTAAQLDAAFGVALHDFTLPATAATSERPARRAQTIHAATRPATLPAGLGRQALGVLGLTSYRDAYVSGAQRALVQRAAASAAASPPAAGPGPPPAGMLTPEQFVHLYGGGRLQRLGDGGAGQTIGIVTLASLPIRDPYVFWMALGLSVAPNRVKLVDVDGGSGPASLDVGSDETTLDVEQAGAVAPKAKIVVYQAPNSDVGLVDAFFAAASANAAGTVSASWIESESYLRGEVALGLAPPSVPAAFNEAFLESAAQGQTVFDGSGDWAAYSASADIGSTNLSVELPSASPYITSIGGTTLSFRQDPQRFPLPNGSTLTVKVPHERIWAWDYLWPEFRQFGQIFGVPTLTEVQWAKANVLGSGGGTSHDFRMPSYQRRFPHIRDITRIRELTPTTPATTFPGFPGQTLPFELPSDWTVHFTPRIANARIDGSHRLEPDLSVNADPDTGYAVYSSLFEAADGTPYLQYGGTSFGAPQMNAVAALVNGLNGGRVGFWNPAVYRFAVGHSSPFTQLNARGSIAGTQVRYTAGGPVYTVPGNDNEAFTGRPGTRYNLGDGLGIPNLTRLGRLLAR
jgi:kumamolisin